MLFLHFRPSYLSRRVKGYLDFRYFCNPVRADAHHAGEGPGRGPEPALVETSTECRLMSYVEQCTG